MSARVGKREKKPEIGREGKKEKEHNLELLRGLASEKEIKENGKRAISEAGIGKVRSKRDKSREMEWDR